VFVCLSARYLKTGAARITKRDIKMETHLGLFWGQRVKNQGQEAQKSYGVGLRTLMGAGFFKLYFVIHFK